MMMRMKKRRNGKTGLLSRIPGLFCLFAVLTMLVSPAAAEGYEGAWAMPEGYQVERVFMLSRHNIRSPLSDGESMLGRIVSGKWFDWSSASGELSLRGGLLETSMGQFFRKWTEYTGLFPANYQPEKYAVRFYANGYQRTQATAGFFEAGLLPMADTTVECHAPLNAMDEIFKPRLRFCNDGYRADVMAQIAGLGGASGLEGLHAGLLDAIRLLMDVTGMKDNAVYQSGEYGDLLVNDLEIILKEGSSPDLRGWLKTATSVADAMIMQYYEEPDDLKAAFGHQLTEDQWQMISGIVTTYGKVLYGVPLVAVNTAHPMLETIRNELTAKGRKFSFYCGHDSNLASVIGALDVEDYTLPEAIETGTPTGAKLMFVRLTDKDGNAWYDVSLVYQSVRQMRGAEILDAANPPVKYAIRFKDVPVNEHGLVAEKDLLKLLDEKIDALTLIKEKYTTEAAENDAA